ncbi:KOW domain-containing RNA-binding protein [Saccharothrix variisporea]|uniref:TROVE domain-containing protein n=1 Tax=Saccharothrix variisporea TaxID=543527 RepID=A0A495X4Y5_9PSEU|nr:hypothetical protein [Saccharothrix variisporea]RKT68596.1 hypothetical protein DFJ66_1788 [Saccharothrix variisporea]
MDRLAAEDMVMFVNAATTSTGQREFHSQAAEQRASLEFLHEYVAGNYRDLYAAVLALDINDLNAALITRRLLATSAEATPEQRAVEGRLIARRLAVMPPQRVYDLFHDLRRAGVNNRRTRAIIRDWLAARPDQAFDAVKYRQGLKRALRHAHVTPSRVAPALHDELGTFLFGGVAPRFRTPLLESWRRAHYEQAAIYDLPYTVAEGFAAKHGVDRSVFLAKIKPNLTRLESLRLRESANTDVDLAAMPLTRLATYVLSLPFADRVARRTELTAALRAAAVRTAGRNAGQWGRVAAVLDDSFSSYGSGVKRRRPLAVAVAGHYLLEALAAEYVPLWTSGATDPLMAHPRGTTPLGHRVLDALSHDPDRLLIISDGWDNSPPGLAGEVLRVWRTRLDPDRRVSATHLNPVYDAGDYDVKRLTPEVPTVGVRNAEDLPALVEFARFTEGRTGFADLSAHFTDRVTRFLETS